MSEPICKSCVNTGRFFNEYCVCIHGRELKEKESKKEEVKYMDINEFREIGLLQEINRLFLHPRGLALEVGFNEDGSSFLSGVWDYRDDPEGITYGNVNLNPTKAKYVQDLLDSKVNTRLKNFGYVIQPVYAKGDKVD